MVIASISKQVVDDINTGNRGIYGSVIKEIRLRASHFMCSFTYESCDLNVEAYTLAKLAHSLGPGRHVSLGHSHDSRCIPQTVLFYRTTQKNQKRVPSPKKESTTMF